MHVSMSHGEDFSRVHSPSAVWVQSISTRGFEVCSRETGTGSNKTGIINWLAYQNDPKMVHGSVTFQGMWTTESKCDKVTFPQVRQCIAAGVRIIITSYMNIRMYNARPL